MTLKPIIVLFLKLKVQSNVNYYNYQVAVHVHVHAYVFLTTFMSRNIKSIQFDKLLKIIKKLMTMHSTEQEVKKVVGNLKEFANACP